MESVTLVASAKSEHGCDAVAEPGAGTEAFRFDCGPLTVCKLGTTTCFTATFENGELRFATSSYSYSCWPDP